MRVFVEAYLVNNLGDDLFVDILVDRYPQTKFIAISDYYNNKKMEIFNKKIANKFLRKNFIKKNFIIKKCDKVVIIGGSIFIENKSPNKAKQFFGNDYYVLGSNFGPFETKKYYNDMNIFFSNAQDVCFRDNNSYELYKDIKTVRKATDIIFSLDISNIHITNRKRVIISIVSCKYKLNNYTNEYEKKIIELIYFFRKKGYEICLISFCKQEGDEEAIESILTQIDQNNVTKYYYNGDRKEALNVLGDCQVIVGSRFHANILGLLLNKTIIPISYSDKLKNVLNDIGYKGKIINIKDIDKFEINSINDYDLNLKTDVKNQIEESKDQFKLLDMVLK